MSTPDVSTFKRWTAAQFGSYMKTKGLGAYYEAIVQHDITGETAPRLSENDLKELGITTLGDRKRFMAAIEELQKDHRKAEREKVLWEDKEVLFFSGCDACRQTCCGFCPIDPSEYKLTTHHLTIKTIQPNRCGPCRCCCGNEYEIDNIDLTYITSGDIKGEAPPCCQEILCCASGRDRVTLATSSEGPKELVLQKGQGERVNRLILNQIEEAQKIERD